MSNLLIHSRGGRYANHVNGRFSDPVSGEYLTSLDPRGDEPWYELADSGERDVDNAVSAAREAFNHSAWRDLTQTGRGKLLANLAGLVEQHARRLAEIETRDNGKLIRETRAQMASLPETWRYYAGMADKMLGETIPVNKPDTFNFTLREPLGVVSVIVPWNSPLYLLSSVLAPCLAVGNTVVAKPAENTSASTLEFAALVAEAGFPAGVFNVITGRGDTTGDALTRHPGVNKIAFTGGTETGRKVAANAARNLVPCHLELGGKSPHVVFDDADAERAVNGVVAGVFAAGGQTCIAGSRCFVQDTVYDAVLERLVARARDVVIGDPMHEDTQLGPLALKSQLHKVRDYVGYGVGDGGRLESGGKQPEGERFAKGYYFEPTVFTDVTNDMRIAREEIFGPVVAVMPFGNEDELIRKANDSIYGLAAGVWTRDVDRAMRFARRVDAGMVWINTYRSASFMSPFGGFKQSGYGKHNGFEGMREFSRLKNVVMDYSGHTQDPFVMKLR